MHFRLDENCITARRNYRRLGSNSFTPSVTAATVNVLKRVLQRKLHDSRVTRRIYLAEGVAVQRGRWIQLQQAVGHIKGFRAKLQRLSFSDDKRSRQGYIQLPESRPLDIRSSHIPDSAGSRLYERVRIQVSERITIRIRIG